MERIRAQRIVAGMAGEALVINRSVREQPSGSPNPDHTPVQFEHSATAALDGPVPQPTGVSPRHTRPESTTGLLWIPQIVQRHASDRMRAGNLGQPIGNQVATKRRFWLPQTAKSCDFQQWSETPIQGENQCETFKIH